MTDPQQARQTLREHFTDITPAQFRGNAEQFSPELLEGGAVDEDSVLAEIGLPGLETEAEGELVHVTFQPRNPDLSAYLASALTGLDDTQRQVIFDVSDVVADVCDRVGIDLYQPRNATDPVNHQHVADTDVFQIDRSRVIGSDLLIFLAHYPSVGAGEELDFAYNALVPIIVISHTGVRVSRMVTGMPGLLVHLSYERPEDLRIRLTSTLVGLRAQLVQRKLAFGEYDSNIVGARIRALREALGLTRAQLARAVGLRDPDDIATIERLETLTDRASNPSLLLLREVAAALRTTVADLVEPNFEQVLLAKLEDWVTGVKASRFPPPESVRDRNRILRRLLLRMIDDLETDE